MDIEPGYIHQIQVGLSSLSSGLIFSPGGPTSACLLETSTVISKEHPRQKRFPRTAFLRELPSRWKERKKY